MQIASEVIVSHVPGLLFLIRFRAGTVVAGAGPLECLQFRGVGLGLVPGRISEIYHVPGLFF